MGEQSKSELVGKTWDGGFAFVKPEDMHAYARATSDEHPSYFSNNAIAPPMFHVRLFKPLLFAIAADEDLGLDLLRLVHGQHDATFHQPLKPWDLVHLRARLEAVEEKSSGLLVTSKLFAFVEGVLAIECITAYFIRGQRSGSKKKAAPPQIPSPDWTRSFSIADDQSLRYAEASLDDNPIHTTPEVAEAAGLPGLILQGLCTMAMSGASVLAQLNKGPEDLKRLSVRFSKPVPNGVGLTTWGWQQDHGVDFLVKGPDDKPVITSGVLELR